MLHISGFSFVGQGENVGMAIHPPQGLGASATSPQRSSSQRANGALQQVRDAQVFVLNLPTVRGLGQFGGFDMYLQDRAGAGRDALDQARNTLLGKAGTGSAC